MDAVFQVCPSAEDMEAAYAMACGVATENDTPMPTYEYYVRAFENSEIIVGKDGSTVVAFCIFHQDGDEIVRSYVVVDADCRQQGLAVLLRGACVAEWSTRGATHETSRLPQDIEWLNGQLTQRGAVLIGTEENAGRIFNVYRRVW